MKRVYERPMMFAQEFMANEYVAACGDSGKVYKFVCDAVGKYGTGLSGYTVYTNGVDKISETDDDVILGSYAPCTATHEANAKDDFIPGYMKKNIVGYPIGEAIPVIIWRGEDGNNIHCTTDLDTANWETAKS